MALTRPLVLPVWADTGDKTAPSNPEVEVGWPVTTIPPSRQRFNWFFNQVHNGVRYLTRRGLADWSADEDYKVGDRCLAADGMTYRCIADHTNIVPGTDATKWERWGYAKSELDAYMRGSLLSPVRCPVSGPAAVPSAASPYTMWQSVAPYDEYWMWMGDAWKVVANRYTNAAYIASNAIAANTTTAVASLVAPRNGKAIVRGIFSALNSSGATIEALSHIRRVRSGVTTLLEDSVGMNLTTAVNHYVHCRPYSLQNVVAGDTFYLLGLVNSAVAAHPQNQNSIHLEYLQ